MTPERRDVGVTWCGMATDEKPRYDGLADWYREHVTPLPLHHLAHRSAIELLGSGAGRRCLDLGCGTGFGVKALSAAGWRVVAVDISADQLAVAAEEVEAEFVRADAARLPFADAAFDAVVSVLTHTDFDDFAAVLAEVQRVLRPQGVFVYVGTHPCFVAPSVERAGNVTPILHPGYRRSGWWLNSPAFGTGIRPRVGVNHLPLSEFLNAFLRSGLAPVEFGEPGDDDYPYFLTVKATR
jgi:ubiquinone/menaquinone biosynthesis C-methylase UbiE